MNFRILPYPRGVTGLLAALSVVLLIGGAAFAGQTFYTGKTLEVIVPFGPGGGTDTWARLIAPFLQKYMGDRAGVQVVNIPGGSGVAGSNEFAQLRRHDGLSALVSSGSAVFPYLLGEPAVRYDFRNFTAIAASPVGAVIYVSPSTGIRTPADLRNSREKLVYAGISATGNDLIALIIWELLDLDVQSILGYRSKGAARIAFEQGESNIDYQTTPAYLANVVPLVEEGKAIPLFSYGLVGESGDVIRDPVFPDLPTVKEVYEMLNGEPPSGVIWDAYKAALVAGQAVQKVLWLHNDAPPEAIETLRRAAAQMAQDPEFRAAVQQEAGDYPFYVGEAAQRAFRAAAEISPEALDWIKQLLREKYGVTRL